MDGADGEPAVGGGVQVGGASHRAGADREPTARAAGRHTLDGRGQRLGRAHGESPETATKSPGFIFGPKCQSISTNLGIFVVEFLEGLFLENLQLSQKSFNFMGLFLNFVIVLKLILGKI